MIAPDQQEQGTNALALAPPDADFFRFGLDSFQAHLEAAKARGMKMRILRRPGLAQRSRHAGGIPALRQGATGAIGGARVKVSRDNDQAA